MRNCVKKYGRKSRTNLLLLLCAYVRSTPYVVTCNICVILFVAELLTYVLTYLIHL